MYQERLINGILHYRYYKDEWKPLDIYELSARLVSAELELGRGSNWIPFHFESNQAWGTPESRDEWQEIINGYTSHWHVLNIAKAKLATYGQDKHYSEFKPNFGHRGEHQGDYTLAEWAKDNHMDLVTGFTDVIDDPTTTFMEDNKTRPRRRD